MKMAPILLILITSDGIKANYKIIIKKFKNGTTIEDNCAPL